MNRDLKWMLLGIFLGVAAVWCLVFGSADRSTVLLFLGVYVLPLVAVICFGTGFTGEGDKPPPDNSSHAEYQNEETDKKL